MKDGGWYTGWGGGAVVTLILFIHANCKSKQVIYAYVSVRVTVVSAPDPFTAADGLNHSYAETALRACGVHLFFM